MESKRIPLKGIVRNSSSQLSEDGEMIDVINLRNKYGKLQPIKDAEKVYQSQYPIVYIHKNLDYENWISYDSNTGNLYWEAKKENDILVPVNKMIYYKNNIFEIKSIGNILIILSENDLSYSLFIDNTYNIIGDIDQKLSAYATTENSGDYSVYINSGLKGIFKKSYGEDGTLNNDTPVNQTVHKMLSEIREEGLLTNPVLLIFTFKLYDGSYLIKSQPILLMGECGERSIVANVFIDSSGSWYHNFYISGYNIKLHIDKILNVGELKDIVSSVDIFISEIQLYDNFDKYSIEKYFTTVTETGKDDIYETVFPFDNLKERIETAGNFYRVDSIDIEDLNEDIDKTLDLKKALENLTVLPSLEESQFSNIVSAKGSYIYNDKIHIWGSEELFPSGYTPNDFNTKQQVYNYNQVFPKTRLKAYILTYIKTDIGDVTVLSKSENFISYGFNPYLSYPDSRAYKMEIAFETENGIVYKNAYDLKPHDFLNIAFFVYRTLQPLDFTDSQEGPFQYPETSDKRIKSNSKIKVSSINNPFVFPPEQTYTVGSGDILGMASVTAALSQGQFGQFPLYVFTTEGIWALQVGTGEVAYTTANPVSRDVCNNPDSITPIDNAVIFTTEKGVNIISGSSVKSLSDDLDGETINISNESSVYFIQNLAEAIATIGLQSSFNDELFTDYIRTARLAYSYTEGEIYAINTSKNYYYCYSIANKEWSKRSGKFKGIIESYPNLYLQNDDNEIFKVNNENGNLKQWIFISRPVKLTGIQHKRIIRSFLRGLYNSTNSSKIAFSIFGSFDGESFELVNSVQGIAKNQRDILLGRSIRPYTYFIFAAYASSGTESEISAIDVMFEQVKRTLAI